MGRRCLPCGGIVKRDAEAIRDFPPENARQNGDRANPEAREGDVLPAASTIRAWNPQGHSLGPCSKQASPSLASQQLSSRPMPCRQKGFLYHTTITVMDQTFGLPMTCGRTRWACTSEALAPLRTPRRCSLLMATIRHFSILLVHTCASSIANTSECSVGLPVSITGSGIQPWSSKPFGGLGTR